MRLTKFGHACVRLEKDGQTIVLDPGCFTEPEAMAGADAVLITHEHPDHFMEDQLREAAAANPALRIWANATVADRLTGLGEGRVQRVGHGDAFDAAGFSVEVHGEWHAVIHPDIPLVLNIGFLVDGEVFHPGDALTLPEQEVPTLLLPVHAPWSKGSEVIDYTRAVGARRAFALHDGLLNDRGLGLIATHLGNLAKDTAYQRLLSGESVELP